jgi:hypothetical protein
MADAKGIRFDVVLFWKLDRFGGSLRHLVNALAEFESLGIAPLPGANPMTSFASLKRSLIAWKRS